MSNAFVAVLLIHLHFPEVDNLKAKRSELAPVKAHLDKLGGAVAEVDHQDLWQRAALAIVTVASSDGMAEQTLSSALHEIERVEPGLVTRSQVEYLR